MASQNRTSVVSDIVKVTFRAKAPMSDAHWKEIGAVLQRANEKRLSVVSLEPSVEQLESKQPGSGNMAKSSNSVQDGLCALLRSGSHR
jgi:hypothetical protein